MGENDTTFAGLPLKSPDHPAGALFRLSRCPRVHLDVQLPQAQIVASSEHPFLVVRLNDAEGRFRDAKDRSLLTAQRVLDMLCVNAVDNLELWGVRGNEHHMVWWTSSKHGSVLRWTTVDNLPIALFDEMARRVEAAVGKITLPPNIRVPEPPVWGDWHPSFRYYRLAQLSDDLVEAFRNMFLAVESVLDSVLPAAGSGLGETKWIRRALDLALASVDLKGRFSDPAHGATPTDYIVAVFYRFHRGSIFHSKLSYGADKLRVPQLEQEESAEKLEQALAELRELYILLARTHLGLDHRGGFTLLQGGFDAITAAMLGKLSLYLTDDATPAEQRENESGINPRGMWMLEMHTRNAKRLERHMTRYFLGVTSGDSIPRAIDVRGVVGGVDGVPALFADTEGVLRPHGFRRIEILIGLTALNQRLTRGAFRT